ncbi:MAG: trypsin-like peptidase domain-containing protein, partial [Rhodospirillales bacterium]|nr:trypsin-like peptidase domain-containing protein [Rhodospirillales bacterium]
MSLYRLIFASLLFLSGPTLSVEAAEKRVPSSPAQIKLSFAPLVKKTAPAVVNIFTQKTVQAQRRVPSLFDDPFFRQFFSDGFGVPRDRPKARQQNSLGSGVIVDPNGMIVTNQHVIQGANEIQVILADRREFVARVLVSDPKTDLAVLKITPEGQNLPYIQIQDSDELEVGDLVLAIGNPFGVGQTVTSGIVSALARTKIGDSNLNSYIQT